MSQFCSWVYCFHLNNVDLVIYSLINSFSGLIIHIYPFLYLPVSLYLPLSLFPFLYLPSSPALSLSHLPHSFTHSLSLSLLSFSLFSLSCLPLFPLSPLPLSPIRSSSLRTTSTTAPQWRVAPSALSPQARRVSSSTASVIGCTKVSQLAYSTFVTSQERNCH